jgi:hypothetical protein
MASAHQKRERGGLNDAEGRAVVVTVTKRSGPVPGVPGNEAGLTEQVAPVGMPLHVIAMVPVNVVGGPDVNTSRW